MINSYFTYYHLLLLDLLDKTVLVIADLLYFFGVCVGVPQTHENGHFTWPVHGWLLENLRSSVRTYQKTRSRRLVTLKGLCLKMGNNPVYDFSNGENDQLIIIWSSTLINWWSNDDQLSTINYETSGDSWSYPKRGGWCQTDQVSNLEIPDFQRKTIETYAQFSALIQKRMRGICIPLPNISG